jgi:hypothetical protein
VIIVFNTKTLISFLQINPKWAAKITTPVQIVQPEETVQLYYELPVVVIIIPTALFLIVIFLLKRKPAIISSEKKSTPV